MDSREHVPESWEKHHTRGDAALRLLRIADNDELATAMRRESAFTHVAAGQSHFRQNDFAINGWLRRTLDGDYLGSEECVQVALVALKHASPPLDSFVRISWQQELPYKVGQAEDKYLATGGYYRNTYNAQHGIIILESCWNPGEKAKYQRPSQPRPVLNHLSDVTALEYIHQAMRYNNGQADNLRFVLVIDISNSSSVDTINHVLKRNPPDQMVPPPPAVTPCVIEAESDDGKALLGMPIGFMLPVMLLQYREHLGHKTIRRMHIFATTLGHPFFSRREVLFELEEAAST